MLLEAKVRMSTPESPPIRPEPFGGEAIRETVHPLETIYGGALGTRFVYIDSSEDRSKLAAQTGHTAFALSTPVSTKSEVATEAYLVHCFGTIETLDFRLALADLA